MAPLTKDSVEVASPAASSINPQASSQSKPTSGSRSDAVSLEVTVKVHGSRVIDASRGAAPQTEPFEEQTVTMIVFPQGAVLRMSTAVNVSQMLVLTNLKTKQDSICRVLKVRPNSNQGSYVEVEFTHRQPGYWGIQFPSEPAAAATIAPPQAVPEPQPAAPPAVAPVSQSTPPAVNRETKPAPVVPQQAPSAPPKPESTFISLGSQEKVQEAASATAITKPLSPVERRLENPPAPVAKNVSPAESPAPPAHSLSMDELLGDTDSTSQSGTPVSVEEEPVSASAASAARGESQSLGAVNSNASPSAASEAFGARLDSSFGASTAKGAGTDQNWMLIAACVAVLVAGLGGGIAYFRQRPASPHASVGATTPTGATTPQSTGSNSNQLPAIIPAGQPYMPGNNAESNQTARPGPSGPAPVAPASNSTVEAKTPAPTVSRTPAPAKQTTPGVTSDMMSSALTARPTTSTRGDEGQSVQAPVLDPAAAASGNAPLTIATTNAASLPSPELRPTGPIKIGGDVKDPKLISSVMPVYPSAARASGVQGDVVIETTIDKSGSVVRMHVVSGPTTLRAAAMDALRRWKYQPSLLDGQPVEVQMQITIKFRI